MKYNYIKGSEKDFEGAPVGFNVCVVHKNDECGTSRIHFMETFELGGRMIESLRGGHTSGAWYSLYSFDGWEVVAYREPTPSSPAEFTGTIYQPESFGHGLDLECEGKDKNHPDCVARSKGGPIGNINNRYTIGEDCPTSFLPNEYFNGGVPSTKEDGIINIHVNKPVTIKKESNSVKTDPMTVTITCEDMQPIVDKAVKDFTDEPIKLSVSFDHPSGMPTITDQFGRQLSNDTTVTYDSTKDICHVAHVRMRVSE